MATTSIADKLAKLEKKIAYVKDRLTELDRMIVKVYEDNVNGKVPDEVCKTLLEKYQVEKTSLQAEQAEFEKRILGFPFSNAIRSDRTLVSCYHLFQK